MAVNRRTYVGRVVSAKMKNTLVVAVARTRHHQVYGKALRRKTMLYVHDPQGESQYGDLVQVVECRPVSKTKRFRLQAILQRHEVLRPEEVAEAEAVMAEAIEAAEEPDAPVPPVVAEAPVEAEEEAEAPEAETPVEEPEAVAEEESAGAEDGPASEEASSEEGESPRKEDA
jgi:small subunit ribosomal protein S17